MSDPNLSEVQVEHRKQLSPILEQIYALAQSAEQKRLQQEREEPTPRAKRATRCTSVHDGIHCGSPAGHKYQHSSGRMGDPVRWE